MSTAADIEQTDQAGSTEKVDLKKRRFLVATTTVIGAAGAAAIAVPFLTSFSPSERARAAGAPVEVELSKMQPGQLVRVEWRGKPVWVLYRSKEMIDRLPELNSKLRDPDSEVEQQPSYAKNSYRSIKPEYSILVGICTHLGCSPTYRPEVGPADLGADWLGGYYCPCHGSRYDLAGRVYKNVPAPKNLVVPPHYYMTDSRVLVGEDKKEA